MSAGKGKRAVASPCAPPHHDGPGLPSRGWPGAAPLPEPRWPGQPSAGGLGAPGRGSRRPWPLHTLPAPPQSCLGGRRPSPDLAAGLLGALWSRGGGHRHPQGHGAGAPRLVNSSVGRSHGRPVPAGAASDAGPPRGSRARPGGVEEEVVRRAASSWTPRGGDRGLRDSLGCTRVRAGLCARGTCGHLCTCECTRVHACCVGALWVCMSVCVCSFTLNKQVFL